jgi:hypothetical protein
MKEYLKKTWLLKPIVKMYRKKRYYSIIESDDIKDRFSNIYKTGFWHKKGQSKSGTGSNLLNTENIRVFLPEIITKLNIKTLLDLGCGDYFWMEKLKLNCNYTGADIVDFLVEENKKNYTSDNVDFISLNAVSDKIKKYDAILFREVLFHLSFDDGLAALKNIKESGSKYLIITNDIGATENKDIRTGFFRKLNLNLSPFNLPKSLMRVEENQGGGRYLEVYEMDKFDF